MGFCAQAIARLLIRCGREDHRERCADERSGKETCEKTAGIARHVRQIDSPPETVSSLFDFLKLAARLASVVPIVLVVRVAACATYSS